MVFAEVRLLRTHFVIAHPPTPSLREGEIGLVMSDYATTISRLAAQWGDRFVAPREAPRFKGYFHGPRVEVTRTRADGTTWVRRGRISISTGWQPVFLLMPRVNSTGSSDTLNSQNYVTRVISA
jgi:hypothetical protein